MASAACLGLSCMILIFGTIFQKGAYIIILAFELYICFSFKNWAMFMSHKWSYVSVAEMGLCFSYGNELCFSYRNGATYKCHK